jgi:hypothetical protein
VNIDISTLVGITVTIVANLLTIIGLIISFIQIKRAENETRQKEAERLTRIEVHVETLWDFHIKRSMVEATTKGVGSMNSPFQVTPDSLTLASGLKEELLNWYKDNYPESVGDRELFIAVGRAFGERLIKEVAIPYNLQEGSCILIAMALIKGELSENNDNRLNFPSIGAQEAKPEQKPNG